MAREEVTAVIKYRVHDMAAAFPLPSADEYAAIKDNVKQFGFIYPKVFWKDGKGDVWLIDGRTRDRIETEFDKAGVEKADSGAALKCAAVFFSGTEAEAVTYTRGLNLTRRSMSSGQKAASAILSGMLYRQYKAKEDGKDIAEEAAEEIADMASRVAKEAGTNRAYVFDCAKLNSENPDLLQRVLGGDLSIPNAKKVAGRRKDGLPDEVEEGGEKPVEVAVDDGPEVILDGLKNPVADDLRAVFKCRAVVKAAKKAAKTIVDEVEEVADQPGGKNISFQTVKSDVNNAVRHLEDHQPHAPCPYCSATGKAGDPDKPNAKCPKCKGRKWLDRLQWKEVPPELRAIFEKKASADDDKGDGAEDAEAGGETDDDKAGDGAGYGT